ncbi:MAG: AMIN domain-containing protein [candidate division Zixibacteria bacterium]|nr:AMIN domain-containing protein [candidate division Zixibacteria bacterium]
MKKYAVLVAVGLLLMVFGAEASEVTNVELSYRQGTTVARIDVDGQVRFTHATEIPKNGKPHRVIVDVLSATHELGAKTFQDVPSCVVSAVRSSQFSVTPEKIVRIVFDMSASPVYQVTSDDHSITLSFADKGAAQFSTWSTAAVVAGKTRQADPIVASAPAKAAPPATARTAVQKNKAIESDRQASLAANSGEAPAPAAKPVAKQPASTVTAAAPAAPTVPAPQLIGLSGKPADEPVSDKKRDRDEKPAAKPSAPKTTAPAVAKPALDEDTRKAKADDSAPAKPAARPAVKQPPVPSPVPSSKTKTELAETPKAPAKPAAPKAQPPAAKSQQALAAKVNKTDQKQAPAAAPKKTEVAQAPAAPAPRQTSRFRRDPGVSAKVKGTMVAEFPKRLVIKYKTRGQRDPFATLIDETRTHEGPIEQRIPNVEGLKLVGVIESGDGANRALFEDKEGFSYILKSGDKVRKGYVLRVEVDRVYFQVFEYGWSRTVALKME